MRTWPMRAGTAALAGIASLGMASACTRIEGREAKPPRPVKAQAATPAPAPAAIRYSASIEALEQVTLAFKSSGYVDTVLRRTGADGRLRAVQAGDVVAKGAALAHVRDSEYRERVTQSRARVAEAEAGLVKARLDLDRARTLFASESLTRPDLDAAQANFDVSAARVATANGDVELAQIALRDCALLAPTAGVVLERKIEAGTLVGAGTVGFVVGDISAVKARFGIPDSMLSSLALGERLKVNVDAVAGLSVEGRVTGIAPAADPQSRVFDVEITIPNRDGTLRPGMIGAVTLDSADATGPTASAAQTTPAVPLTAIVRAKDGQDSYAAFVVERKGEADIARLRPVRLGPVVGNTILVVGGLTTGDRVIVSGATLLVDGEPIRVLP
jgi:RND family efflux transporter MFP subunit